MGIFGWQDYAVVNSSAVMRRIEERDLPLSLSLGILGRGRHLRAPHAVGMAATMSFDMEGDG